MGLFLLCTPNIILFFAEILHCGIINKTRDAKIIRVSSFNSRKKKLPSQTIANVS